MQTPSVSIVTPSYSNDLQRCELLCETIDRFVTGYEHHFIVVGDEDLDIFRHLSGPARTVVPSSQLLPRLLPLPKWRGRRYWWSPRIRLPVYGWHLQQLRKFAMAAAQQSDRVLFMDSDGVFCRPTDLGQLAGQPKSPLFHSPGDINPSRPHHVRWWRNAHRILGLEIPALPGDDFIGPMIVWERETVKGLLARIESVCGCPWWVGLARQRHFSEYLIYGIAVASDPVLAARHERTCVSHCLTYWGGPQLDKAGLISFMEGLQPSQHAITIQSHTATPLRIIREVALAEPAAQAASGAL
ncbi:DUF6492 family protein [Labrenzia sp. 011]|uniref:DUF6492 family protein n=1 Tax=Labrenzia sp. 011 TaxID=2171494 RepID=UPI000D515C88|nr:DUF6492 family protein [Labrenzia sp. 011]PVB60672.1 hypothetical protein DCO57_15885 [Labrenzia sp. 011]